MPREYSSLHWDYNICCRANESENTVAEDLKDSKTSKWQLLYSLRIPNDAAWASASEIPFMVDESSTVQLAGSIRAGIDEVLFSESLNLLLFVVYCSVSILYNTRTHHQLLSMIKKGSFSLAA